jgi:hypothetical protein
MARADKHRILQGILLLVMAAAPAAPALAAAGCTTVVLDETFVLPDGSEYDAGELSLCVEHEYSPVASLHAVRVDGAGVGLVASRRGRSEGEVERPFMMFFRDGRGRLHLAGYAIPSRDSMLTYDLVNLRGSSRARRIAGLARGDRATGLPTVPAVVLAARVD